MKLSDLLFMAKYHGMACAVCGKTHWHKIPTVGHHLLPKSVFPQFRYTHKNIMPLCPEHHEWAETQPEEFQHYLHDEHPAVSFWVITNHHHRDYVAPDYKAIYLQLASNINEETGGE